LEAKENSLFTDSRGHAITQDDIVKVLEAVGAEKCDTLLIHSELSFGTPNLNLGRNEILGQVMGAFQALGVKTLLFPTFTFSFSNYEDYDIMKSRSRMGVLTEFARKQPLALRSIDPQMSFAVLGQDVDLVTDIGKECIGARSTFEKLHNKENVRILFFGTSVDACFTYQHYIEYVLHVPYRYNLDFIGTIVDDMGRSHQDTYTIFVKYRDVIPWTPPTFEKSMIESGAMLKASLGDSSLTCFSERDAFSITKQWIENDINAFLAQPYDSMPLVKEYRYGNVTTVQ